MTTIIFNLGQRINFTRATIVDFRIFSSFRFPLYYTNNFESSSTNLRTYIHTFISSIRSAKFSNYFFDQDSLEIALLLSKVIYLIMFSVPSLATIIDTNIRTSFNCHLIS